MNTPLALIAELTHRCPLQCVYCSNPLELQPKNTELASETWMDVFRQAAGLGSLQLHLTGGEPLARTDLLQLVKSAHGSGLYINLITSGIGLTGERLQGLIDAGLDHIQLSLQGGTANVADRVAGVIVHERKLAIAQEIRKHRIAFTVNLVVHRGNLDQLPEMIALAAQMGAHKLEIANVQYYGWAFTNREFLLPTRLQVEQSIETVKRAQQQFSGKMRIDFVTPDYYAKFPKVCMGGWGRKIMLIHPTGEVWPCHSANVIPGMQFDNVRDKSLRWIWEESAAFQRYRGDAWMPEPCHSCERRNEDFGGCRCQAWLLTNDAEATDPVCSLAPQHQLVRNIVEGAQAGPVDLAGAAGWKYRQFTKLPGLPVEP
ncbi:MAG TPA: pyrroloquinoline quinone biosynthesis protein PqqE [Candidatus Saccharimonadales bacterium]|jgi:pyrroloquinoline quinone biosynthesis protein E|nr:pyrroloquinoline quinone biosynthesis protein PqqE [Candidatus Saccharimonadales bacterium]